MINNAKVVIIHFIVELYNAIVKSGYNFRSWKYVIFKIRYSSNLEAKESDIFFDFEYEVTLDNRAYLLKNVFELKIRKMVSLISIWGVENKVVNTNKYIIIIAYVNDVINNIIRTICFTMKISLVNDFKVNIFFRNEYHDVSRNDNEFKNSYFQIRKMLRIINIDRRYRTNLILF